ncbi:MAG: iron-containing alcohol dehydrogenase [Clostridia bacterium]|nr:iron-containing alcohol dehydrogenase [Clostridia bacterium]
MGRRFLNVKTKEIFLGDNAGKKINEVLEKYLPYQKVLIVTTSKLKKNEEKCYENLLKSIKNPNFEYIFSKKIDVNKNEAINLLKNVSEDVACILAIGSTKLINLVKVISFIKSIPYIIYPTVKIEPQYLCRTSEVEVDGVTKFYKVNPPLAIIAEKSLLLKTKKTFILDTFCQIVGLTSFLLDEFLIGACQAKTIFLHHFEAIKNLIINTINLDEKLYNYKPEAIIKLMNNALKAGIILQSLNCKNIDSATLNSLALSQINNDSKIHPAYYKVISSLFLFNIYESFIVNLKENNYLLVDIKNRLKVSAQVFYGSSSLKVNLINNIKQDENLKMCVYHIKEFEDEMLSEIAEAKKIMLKAYTIFKRMNLKLSFYIEKSLNSKNIKKAICLSPDISTSDNFLKILCRFGVLDYNF